MYKNVIIKKIKSCIKCNKKQKLSMISLGLKKINGKVKKKYTPQIAGIINKIKHLIKVKYE